MEELEPTTQSTRRLRTRVPKPPLSPDSYEEDSPPTPKICRTLTKKAIVSVEKLYLQGNYKEPVPTPLETIFESPRPTKSQQDSLDTSMLMGRRKLKRLCVFGSHYKPTRTKQKQRKDHAYRMKQLTGVCVPLGKAFSEEDVMAAFSCLTEEVDTQDVPSTPDGVCGSLGKAFTEDVAPFSCVRNETSMERETQDLPRTPDGGALVERVTDAFHSLQMNTELPSASQMPRTTPKLPPKSKQRRQKRRSNLFIPISPSSSTIDHQSQPSTTRQKRVKCRAGEVLSDQTSQVNPIQTNDLDYIGPLPSTSQRKRQKTDSTQGSEASTTTSGNKRTPESSPTIIKKQRTPNWSTEAPSRRGRRGKGKRRVSGVERVLYHHSALTMDSANTTPTSSATPSPLQPQTTENHSPLHTIPDPPTGTGAEISPTSPSTRMAALSLHSPSPVTKPRKMRRRSARLSIGSDVQEWRNRDASLGTFWTHSPAEKQTSIAPSGDGRRIDSVNSDAGKGDSVDGPDEGRVKGDNDASMNTKTKNAKKKNPRKRSDAFLPRVEIEIIPTLPPTSPTHTECKPSPTQSFGGSGGDMGVCEESVMGEGGKMSEGMSKIELCPVRDSTSSTPSPSIINTAFHEPPTGCVDLLTPSPISVTPTTATQPQPNPESIDSIPPPNLTSPLSIPSPILTTRSPPILSPPHLTPTTRPQLQPKPLQHPLGPEEDWDSPVVAGILTNETLIRMGQVYYGTPLSSPPSAKV